MTVVEWYDQTDPYRGERSYPKRHCMGCGTVALDLRSSMSHETRCPVTPLRYVACWRCATENWKRTECRCCGNQLR